MPVPTATDALPDRPRSRAASSLVETIRWWTTSSAKVVCLLANLRGWLEESGGLVIRAAALAAGPYLARSSRLEETIRGLQEQHRLKFEKRWCEHFGHAFDCLTQQKARYLAHSPDADTIRDPPAETVRPRSDGCRPRSFRERRNRFAELKERQAMWFPNGGGRSGGFRTIILLRRDALAFSACGFAKSQRERLRYFECAGGR